MTPAGLLRTAYLTHLSQPLQDRRIYKAISQRNIRSILEIGIGMGIRASRMLELAARQHAPSDLRYVGIDLFETRPGNERGLTLKATYRLLASTGVSVRLLPGTPYDALSLAANGLGAIDLVIIGADQEVASLSKAWFYFPRVLHKDSLVFLEARSSAGTLEFKLLSFPEVAARAREATPNTRRAA